MAEYRIEIVFSGDAPESELARAAILAGAGVATAIDGLAAALMEAGFAPTVTAHAIRRNPKRSRRDFPRDAAAAE
jgi:hypothetical protein